MPMKALAMAFALVVTGCAPPTVGAGYYTGLADIHGVTLRLVVDLRADKKAFAWVERVAEPDPMAIAGVASLVRWAVVQTLEKDFATQNGRWERTVMEWRTIRVFSGDRRLFQAKVEPNGDLLIGEIRLSSSGREPLTRFDWSK